MGVFEVGVAGGVEQVIEGDAFVFSVGDMALKLLAIDCRQVFRRPRRIEGPFLEGAVDLGNPAAAAGEFLVEVAELIDKIGREGGRDGELSH